MELRTNDGLIIVDVQNDFCQGGALPVPDGDAVVPVINRLTHKFKNIYLTRDWHPANHISFSENPQFVDKSWPPHCIQNTPGASFHKDLVFPCKVDVINTGTEPEYEGYSGFEGTDLAERLRSRGIGRVFVCGLATDFCVKATALDARREGFEVVLVEDACRGIDSPPGTVAEALDEMAEAGVVVARAGEIE